MSILPRSCPFLLLPALLLFVAGCPPAPEVCGDTFDNDEDGLADCEDPDCFEACTSPEDCGDGLDNDGDGVEDCEDTDCEGVPPCLPPEACEGGEDEAAAPAFPALSLAL